MTELDTTVAKKYRRLLGDDVWQTLTTGSSEERQELLEKVNSCARGTAWARVDGCGNRELRGRSIPGNPGEQLGVSPSYRGGPCRDLPGSIAGLRSQVGK